MTPLLEQLEQRLKGWGIEPDPKILDRYKIKVEPLRTLDCGPFTFYRNPKAGRLLYEALVRRKADRCPQGRVRRAEVEGEIRHLPVSDAPKMGLRWRYNAGSPSTIAEFQFRFCWPATEVDGEMYVGEGKFG